MILKLADYQEKLKYKNAKNDNFEKLQNLAAFVFLFVI